MNQRQAAVVVIECQGRVLLLLRAQGGPRPGTFCFPGGHAEPHEVPKRTAARETREETTILLHDWDRMEQLGEHDLAHAFITAFKYGWDGGFPQVILSFEHEGYLWVDPKEDWVHRLPFTGKVVRSTLAGMR